MANYDFKPDLRDGQQGQNVMKHFLEMYFGLKCLSQGFTSEYDLKMASRKLSAAMLKRYDAVLISTDHSNYDFQFIVDNARLVIDTRNATKGVKRGRRKIVKA